MDTSGNKLELKFIKKGFCLPNPPTSTDYLAAFIPTKKKRTIIGWPIYVTVSFASDTYTIEKPTGSNLEQGDYLIRLEYNKIKDDTARWLLSPTINEPGITEI